MLKRVLQISIVSLGAFAASDALATDITFEDIARDPSAGFEYERTPSERVSIIQQVLEEAAAIDPDTGEPRGYFFPFDTFRSPIKPRGIPGIVVFDADSDGDQDVYVTNGPGTANSLFENQLMDTGVLTFVDIGVSAGVAATDQDSAGAVAGDLDNDGDADLIVLGAPDINRVFENLGGGLFNEVTDSAGLGNEEFISQSASLGDIDGDGLLDLFIANGTDYTRQNAIFEPFPVDPETGEPINYPNRLYLNRGGLHFEDVSEESGILLQEGFPEGFERFPSMTHVVVMYDYDQDGDIDILSGNDQAFNTPAEFGGTDRGLWHLHENDGSGHFIDVNKQRGVGEAGAWMGVAVADYNSDGRLDFFGSNLGFYATAAGANFPAPTYNSRYYLQQEDGSFQDFVGDNFGGATVFGWGASPFDFDNDGDMDLIFHGGLDIGPIYVADNPGALYENDGHANFVANQTALANSTNHNRRIVHGVAVGDLNNDGFPDMLSAANVHYPEGPLGPFEPVGSVWDPQFDENGMPVAGAVLLPLTTPTEDPARTLVNPGLGPLLNGNLSVEINSANNGNNWLK
ncbi:MAG: VCBS repeat-containing protein, partial [Myxococcota bacterium]